MQLEMPQRLKDIIWLSEIWSNLLTGDKQASIYQSYKAPFVIRISFMLVKIIK